MARRYHSPEFLYRGERVGVASPEHQALLATAINAKIEQDSEVRIALRETGLSRLVFPLIFSMRPGPLARATALTLMLERCGSDSTLTGCSRTGDVEPVCRLTGVGSRRRPVRS